MAESSGVSPQSRLLYVTHATTKQQFLIDIGAEVSVLPPWPTDRTNRQGYDLQAANCILCSRRWSIMRFNNWKKPLAKRDQTDSQRNK